jgi:DUF4097 and DUF4098 domain-containing protein YvlB
VIATALLMLAAVSPDTTLRLPRGGTVQIESGFRTVTLSVGTGDQVTVSGAAAELEGNTITVDAGFAMRRRTGDAVRVSVPAWAKVEVTVVSGSLEVPRAPEVLTAEVVNGHIVASGGTGTMSLITTNGHITVTDFAGTLLEVEAITGPITIDGATGRVQASGVNDPIQLRNIRSTAVEAASVNGRVAWVGDFQPGGRYRFETHNGGVDLTLPASVGARLHVTTFMGGFTSALPATTNGRGSTGRKEWPGGQDLTVVYGSGAADVTVETYHGAVRVREQGST